MDVALALGIEKGAFHLCTQSIYSSNFSIDVVDAIGGHIIVFTNGSPSYGPGAIPLDDSEGEVCLQSLFII